ncbi:hypothetical protein C8F01DRAFT_1325381 [Mycena amicta]|nr:hypothetical protein C8F01DRAFT_1325381 [Mycena amicta]
MLFSTELHSTLNLYGAFALILPKNVLVTLSMELARCNVDWDDRYVEDRNAARDLDMTSETSLFNITTLSWEVLMLYPDCPAQRGVLALDPNNPLLTGFNTPPNLMTDYRFLLLHLALFITVQKQSVFAVLANYASKIHAFVSDENSEVSAEMKQLDARMQLLMGRIFHVPNKQAYREPLVAALVTPFLNNMEADTLNTPTSREGPDSS